MVASACSLELSSQGQFIFDVTNSYYLEISLPFPIDLKQIKFEFFPKEGKVVALVAVDLDAFEEGAQTKQLEKQKYTAIANNLISSQEKYQPFGTLMKLEATKNTKTVNVVEKETSSYSQLYGDVKSAAVPITKKHVQSDTPGRNQDCPCGSGKRYKACHGRPQVIKK